MVHGLAAANLAVYVAWLTSREGSAAYNFLFKWFLSSAFSLRRGLQGAAEMVLSCFSHQNTIHFGLNMMGYYSFLPRLAEAPGRSTAQAPRLSALEVLGLYLGSGFLGSLCSALFMRSLHISMPGLGASGSIFGFFTYYALSHPEHQVVIFFFFPFTAIGAVGVATAMNLGFAARMWYVARRMGGANGAIDGMAHIGGTVAGALFYGLMRAKHPDATVVMQYPDSPRPASGRGSSSGGDSGSRRDGGYGKGPRSYGASDDDVTNV
jgi:rhomboid-like protein